MATKLCLILAIQIVAALAAAIPAQAPDSDFFYRYLNVYRFYTQIVQFQETLLLLSLYRKKCFHEVQPQMMRMPENGPFPLNMDANSSAPGVPLTTVTDRKLFLANELIAIGFV